MVSIRFLAADGSARDVVAKGGLTLMEAAVNAGIAGVDAECGGSCSCGTCHVQIDPRWCDLLDPPGEEEVELLELFQNRSPQSRLSCQITLSDALDDLIVTVPFPNGPE